MSRIAPNSPDLPLEELVAQAVNGNFEAFEHLIEFYTPALWRFVFRLVGNYEEANDTVQQVLIQAYAGLAKLENPASFRVWLFTIARHRCIDLLRRQPSLTFSDFAARLTKGEATGEDPSPLNLFPDPGPLPEELVERREMQVLLQEAIASLPGRSRQVVTLRYATELTFAEIGQVLGMNENSVKTLFQRAKVQLRLYLRQEWDAESQG
jgi:RNA polymerase sigma factor (sigma-70 family)